MAASPIILSPRGSAGETRHSEDVGCERDQRAGMIEAATGEQRHDFRTVGAVRAIQLVSGAREGHGIGLLRLGVEADDQTHSTPGSCVLTFSLGRPMPMRMVRSTIQQLFVTKLYRAALAPARARILNADLLAATQSLEIDDDAGRAWCEENGFPGYTSYASLNDLTWRMPIFAALEAELKPHVAAFARQCGFDLQGGRLTLDAIWVNVLPPGGYHTAHIHPHAVVSGTYYVVVPEGSAALKLEDPRLAMMMAAPPRKKTAPMDQRSFITVAPAAGTILLWESWLRHEVPVNRASDDRVSVSFNYRWG